MLVSISSDHDAGTLTGYRLDNKVFHLMRWLYVESLQYIYNTETDLEIIIPINGHFKFFLELPSRRSPGPPYAGSTNDLTCFWVYQDLVSLQITSTPMCSEDVKVGTDGIEACMRVRMCIYVGMIDEHDLCT